ncbi:proline-rich receptor-like protein kinase PERK4 [Amaranthus tricolor]|uniref:proline-rich receptor-like protein kinase PERK4 n=1 Tax=Amaranthus tricolor TaxID=29722 RepID=UPI002586E9F7|nr:proline-rich receptor-like protein kinase PERK4 [Amaranthus tricolor]
MSDGESSPSPDQSPSKESPPSPPPPSETPPSSPPPSPPESDTPPATPPASPSPPPPSEGGVNNNQPPPSPNLSPPIGGATGGGGESTPLPPQNPVAPPAPPGLSTQQPSPPTLNTYSHNSSKSTNSAIIAGVAAAGGIILMVLLICIFCLRKKKRKYGATPPYGWDAPPKPQGKQQNWQSSSQDHVVKIGMPPPSGGTWGQAIGSNGDSEQYSTQNTMSMAASSPSLSLGFNKSTFTYDELAAATNGFDKSYMLGQGGFGYVYKGILPNGKEIAVKSLKTGSGQGEREFQAEVEIISRVHHRHLVSLVGYCISGGQRMLVYDFVPNDTLEYHLHKKGELDFPTRLRIALGSAKGLAYLHEDCHPRIIHRDIKASNILLDENYEAMVADFGLAKLTTDTNTHVSTRVMGTFGYLAPEYASSGKLTEKSDVFSFGVMLLEVITGRRPVDPNMTYMEDSLVDWLRPLLAKSLETGNYHEFVDPRLEGNYDPHLMKRMVACAAASIRHSGKRRPKMSQIVRALEGDSSLEDLNYEGGKQGHGSIFISSEGGSDYDSRAYSADLKKFRQMAFSTQDFATTSE